jgi:hypothetical protein
LRVGLFWSSDYFCISTRWCILFAISSWAECRSVSWACVLFVLGQHKLLAKPPWHPFDLWLESALLFSPFPTFPTSTSSLPDKQPYHGSLFLLEHLRGPSLTFPIELWFFALQSQTCSLDCTFRSRRRSHLLGCFSLKV